MQTTSDEGTAASYPSRRLTTHQQAVLIQVLLTFPDEPVGVCYWSGTTGARKYAEDFLNGIESAPQALVRVMQSENFGTQLVKIAD